MFLRRVRAVGGADRIDRAHRVIGLEEQDYDTKLMMYMFLIRRSEEGHGHRYEKFAYLKRLPAGAIKIDHSFAQGLREDVEDTAIVRMIMEADPYPELLA